MVRWGLALLLLGALGLAVVQLGLARSHLEAGANDLTTLQATLAHNPLATAHSRARLLSVALASRSEFRSAQGDLWLWRPILDHLSWAPDIGPELAAAAPLADAGSEGSDAVVMVLNALSGVWSAAGSPGRKPARPLLARLLPPLHRGGPALARAQTDLTAAGRALDRIPTAGMGELCGKIARARGVLPSARAAVSWLAAAPAMLGESHPSHMLLVFEDSRELRATGGFIGAVDYITFRKGVMQSLPSGSALPHEQTFPLPAPEAEYTYEAYWLFRDSNWSPDFPLTARYERWMYGDDTGRWAPFVVDVLDAAPDIVSATGPVYLSAYHQLITPSNVEALAQQYIYDTYHSGGSNSVYDAERVAFLGELTGALVNRIQSLDLRQLLLVGSALHRAIVDQQLLMYDRKSSVEQAITLSGASGAVPRPESDLVYVVDDNRSYSKLNPYIDERASYDVSIRPNLSAEATLTLRYHVRPSPASIEGFGPYFGSGGTKHDYLDFVRVYVPPGSRLQGTRGFDQWAPQPAYGLTQFAGGILIREGATKTLVVHYRLPAGIFHSSRDSDYVLTTARQPGTNIHAVRVTVRLPPTAAFQSSPGTSSRTFTVSLSRAVNTLQVPLAMEKHPAVPPLVPTTSTGDPYIPAGTLGNRRHPL